MNNIPKIAHLCWFGSQPMPMINVFTVLSFHRLNPDWAIKVYVSEEDTSDFGSYEWVPPYQGEDMFHLVKQFPFVEIIEIGLKDFTCPVHTHIIAATDVFRQEILYREGGIYSDFDVIWLKPMSYFSDLNCLGNKEDFQCTVSFYEYTHGHHNVSNIVAEKESKFLFDTLQATKEIKPPFTHQAFGTDMFNKLYPSWESITDKYDRMVALRYETFFPFGIFNLIDLYQKRDIMPAYQPNVMAVHWFGGHQYSHAYIDNDGFNRDCAMTSILKREGLI